MAKQALSHIEKVLNVWAIVLILWSLYRFYFKTFNPLWVDEVMVKPVIFLGPVLYFVKNVEKRSLKSGLGFNFANALPDVVLSVVIGIFFIVLAVVKNGVLNFPPNSLYLFVVALISAFSEEVLSRGFVLTRLYEKTKNMYTSTIYASVLFFILRIPILFAVGTLTGFTLTQVMITSFVLSLVVSSLFLVRRSILLPIVIHSLYMFAFYLVS